MNNKRKRAGSQASNAKKKPNAKVVEEVDDNSGVDSDEYQDIVYDVEQTQALMDMADDFLHQPILSLPAPGDD